MLVVELLLGTQRLVYTAALGRKTGLATTNTAAVCTTCRGRRHLHQVLTKVLLAVQRCLQALLLASQCHHLSIKPCHVHLRTFNMTHSSKCTNDSSSGYKHTAVSTHNSNVKGIITATTVYVWFSTPAVRHQVPTSSGSQER